MPAFPLFAIITSCDSSQKRVSLKSSFWRWTTFQNISSDGSSNQPFQNGWRSTFFCYWVVVAPVQLTQ